MMEIDYENRKVYHITCERELQEEVVKFLNTTDLMFSCSHTDGMLNTPERRNEARMMGYRKGLPDIIIYTPCTVCVNRVTGLPSLFKPYHTYFNHPIGPVDTSYGSLGIGICALLTEALPVAFCCC